MATIALVGGALAGYAFRDDIEERFEFGLAEPYNTLVIAGTTAGLAFVALHLLGVY